MTSSASAGDLVPRLAVLLGAIGSLSPVEITRAAGSDIELLFLVDTDPADDTIASIAQALSPTIRVAYADPGACATVLRQAGTDAVTTFADRLCPLAAALRQDLLAPGGKIEAAGWGRKDVQRQALRAAGVSTVRSARLSDGASLREFAASVGYPFVVKPVDGVSSRDTWLIAGAADVRAFLRAAFSERQAKGKQFAGIIGDMYVEEYIHGDPPRLPWLADYVSVEVFLSQGAVAASLVTDRLVPAWPFRETGAVLPTSLDPAALAGVTDHAIRALAALGAPDGAYHVEIKPRADGPEVVEVNGRLGGFMARLARYAGGADLARAALAAAASRPVTLSPDTSRAVAVLTHQPPAGARRVSVAPTRREVSRLPGVLAVDVLASSGQPVDWRMGTGSAVAVLWCAGDDHLVLRQRVADLTAMLSERFAYAIDTSLDGDGLCEKERA